MLDIDLQHSLNTSDYNNTFLPILLSRLKKKTLYSEIANYIPLTTKYNNIIEHIEENIKKNSLNGASITIQLPKTKKIICKHKVKRTLKNTDITHLHQLYLIVINDNNKNNNDLLEIARNAGYEIYMTMKTNSIKNTNIIDSVCESNFIYCIIEGLLLSSYKFLKYKTKIVDNLNFKIDKINIVSTECARLNNSTIQHKKNKLNNLLVEIESVYMARDLVNEPANNNKANFVLNTIKKEIEKHKLPITIDILDSENLKEEKLNLILAVGQGSNKNNKPKLIILKYNPNHVNVPEYVLIGKGVTFDTGGLDLKKHMEDMKTDIGGAVTVLSFILGYAKLKGNKNIYVVCPFVENSIGPNSIKPSDVIKSYSGKTVEIINTDAEGRLILADTLSWCTKKWPTSQFIDFATLTGQQESLSCKVFSNIMGSNSDSVINKLIKEGDKINEPLVHIPIFEDKFIKKLESNIADIKNINMNCNADMILATVFLKQFINKDTKWIHIDFAGPIYKLSNDSKNKYMVGEASGIGVRLLFDFFDNY